MMARNALEMWCWMAEEILEEGALRGSRAGKTREVLGWSGKVGDARLCWAGGPRKASLGYGYAELLWYLRGEAAVSPMLTAYAPSYARFANDGEAMGAYGHRWLRNPGVLAKGGGRSSLWHAVELLRERPDDRRAVVSFWDSGDVVEARRGAWNDIPCTVALQLIARDGHLHGIATMRSNDAWLGGVYDVFCFCQLVVLAAASLGLEPGSYTHTVGSMHLYEKDFLKAEAALDQAWGDGWGASCGACPMPTREEADALLRMDGSAEVLMLEPVMRAGGPAFQDTFLQRYAQLPAWSKAALKAMGDHLEAARKRAAKAAEEVKP